LAGEHDPRWSPDGESLLIPLERGASVPDPEDGTVCEWRDAAVDEGSQIWELPLDVGTPRPVPPDDPRSHWDATWSDNGALVAYAIDASSTAWSLIVAAANGSDARELVLTPGSRRHSWWDLLMSPAGDQVAFHTGASPDELQVVEVATGVETSLAVAGVVGSPNSDLFPIAFSPDGGRVLFSTVDRELRGSLWSVGVDGSDPQQHVTGTQEGDWRP
jgi:Tol biopolymer transport system component